MREKEACPDDHLQYETWSKTFNTEHPKTPTLPHVVEAAAKIIRRERA